MNIIKFEKEIDLFVNQNNLEPADAIMVKKNSFKLLNHYIIYLGSAYGKHMFMANTLKGIKLFDYEELMKELYSFTPVRIDKFTGTLSERKKAVHRALSRKDENSYHLILNNCEHFKNWVQKGIHKSEQVENVSKLAIGAGAFTALASKKKGGVFLGLGLMFLGGIAWALSSDDNIISEPKIINNKR